MKLNEIVEKLLEAKRQYYTTGNSFLTDSQFDELEEKLREEDPNNKYFSIVGTNIKGSNNIKHNHKLLSCAKGKKPEDAIKWLERINYSEELVGMAKLDGLTGCITYVDGKFSHMSTRGNGEIGQDVSHLQSYLNIPKEIPHNGVVDVVGEIILPKNTKLETNGKPLRNIASGLVNRKEVSDDLKHLHFVAYNLLGQNNLSKFRERLDRLNLLNFETVFNVVIEKGFIPSFYKEYEEKLREEFLYETDGIILQVNDLSQLERINSLYVVDHHNHFNFALKPKSESAITTLTGITWDVSKYGYCIPVANFEPAYLGNKEIKNCTLNNYEMVEKLDLRISDEITIENANEVIPYFKNKIQSNNGESLLIDKCPCCGTKLIRDGVHAKCTNKNCPDMVVKQVLDYCTKCEMDGVSQSTVETLWGELSIDRPVDLYKKVHLHKDKLLSVDGFGQKKVDNLLRQIEKSKKQTVKQFIARLGIESVGERAVENLGIDTIEKFWKFNDTKYINGQSLITYRDSHKEEIEELLQYVEIVEEKKSVGIKLVSMTGKGFKGRKELITDIEAKGYSFSETINKDLEYLICEDVNGSSSKLEKAKKLGITLVSYEEFFKC